MKHTYMTPESEKLEYLLSYCMLQDSLIDSYSGEDAYPVDGQW